MSAGELLFDPTTEFQVIEEFEFDERIERPSNIRFFGFEEQANDFVEKLLPKTGRVAKGIIRRAEYEVGAFAHLYKTLLQEIPEGYQERKYKLPDRLTWVHYINSNRELAKNKFDFNTFSLLQTEAGPNFYFRMLDSIPRSPQYFADGDVLSFSEGRININGVYFLNDYVYSKTLHREDGTFSIEKIPRVDTRDITKFTGYSVDSPPLDAPNPLTDNVFLSAHPEPAVLDTTEPLSEILPSMETIFEHAIPETGDPYGEGQRYLKIFDIRIRDVPFELWTRRFPPVPAVDVTPAPISVSFPSNTQEQPAKQILDTYKSPWYSGISSRYWLSMQEDNGYLIAKMLLSKVGNLGPIAIPPPIPLPDAGVIQGTPDECLPTEITGFDDFLTRGIFRAPQCASCGAVGHSGKSCPIKKSSKDYKDGHGCIPLAFVSAEREALIYSEKEAWTPATEESMLREHIAELERHRNYHTEYFTRPPASKPASLLSETRKLIVEILRDDTKLPEDQLFEIQDLLRDAVLENYIYTSSDGAFLICQHELDILKGEFNRDPDAYLQKWCAKVDGFYVCQYSGERVAEVIQNQDQFDEQGHVINKHDKISANLSFLPKEHLSFAVNLRTLQGLFNTGEPAEDIMYLLISLLQVLPEEKQLIPLISYVREESIKVRTKLGAKLAEKKNDVDLMFGMFGFNAIVILLQTHLPQLIPRRSFGGRPLVLQGFPRDDPDSNNAPLVDSLLGALTQTFENYPSTFRGSSVVFLRTLLKDRRSVKKLVISGLQKQFAPKFKDLLLHSKDNLEAVAIGYTLEQAFQPPVLRPQKDVTFLTPDQSVVKDAETRYNCYSGIPWYEISTPFSFRQPELPIVESIAPAIQSQPVERPAETDTIVYKPSLEEVRNRLKIKRTATSAIFKRILELESARTLQMAFLRMLTLSSLENPSPQVRAFVVEHRSRAEYASEDASLLRDYFKGLILEFLTFLTPGLERAIIQDIPLRSVLSTVAESRAVIDKLGAAEREAFKARLRRMPDTQREVTKQLIDLGLAPYLITKADRESFMKELQDQIEPPTDNPLVAPGQEVPREDVPEEGLHDERDVGPQGEVPVNEEGQELLYDYGDYGDARARTSEGEEYVDAQAYNYEEDFGI